MKMIALTVTTLVSLSAAAAAQERFPFEGGSSFSPEIGTGLQLAEPQLRERDLAIEAEPPLALPRSLSEPAPLGDPIGESFSLGAFAGLLRAHTSSQATWFGGVQARLHFGMFAAEASIQFHQDQYQNGNVVVTQYPVQLTAFLYFMPEGPVRPYILGGVGWYYTSVDYRGILAAIPDKADNMFGEHLGAGVELHLAPQISIDADLRYIFLNPTTQQVIGRNFNYWQITLGLNFFF